MTEDPPLVEGSIKPTYVGEVDANAPAPFSVTALVDSGAKAGSYQASILVYYRDDLQAEHAMTIPVTFTVVSELPETTTAPPTMMSQLTNPLLLLGAGAVILLLAIAIYARRRKRATVQE
jgi:LPXTG-motif cell wall-anchored protein